MSEKQLYRLIKNYESRLRTQGYLSGVQTNNVNDVIGYCLPINYVSDFKHATMLEFTDDQKQKWCKANPGIIRCWGSVDGNIYIKIVKKLCEQFCIFNFTSPYIQSCIDIKNLSDVVMEYLVGPINTLVECVTLLENQAIDTFLYNSLMQSAEDKMMLSYALKNLKKLT